MIEKAFGDHPFQRIAAEFDKSLSNFPFLNEL